MNMTTLGSKMGRFSMLQTRQDLQSIDLKIDHNSNGWKMMWEWHKQIEILYILEGQGKCYIEDNEYDFVRGDLFVISPYKLHKTELVDKKGFKVLVIIFNLELGEKFPNMDGIDVLEFIKVNYADYSPMIKLDNTEKERLELIFDRMQTEYNSFPKTSLDYLISLLHILIIEINRIYNKKITVNKKCIDEIELPQIIVESIGYINQNFKQDLNLTRIASVFHINPSYLSREFKKRTDMTVTEFLNSRRIHYARNLLAKTDLKIIEIALDSGYNNIPYFTSVFKKFVGMTPKQFRNKSRARVFAN